MHRLVMIACAAACSRGSDQDGRQWQASPPPQQVSVPAGLSIDVEIDHAAHTPITSATLAQVKPDFVDPEHHVWLIATLVPEAAPAGTLIEATAPNGVSIKLAHPTTDGLEPVVFLTRRGELIVSAIDPKDPFPRWHGQGGRVHRAGDSTPHIAPVTKLAITHTTR
jgi:hypothetical protein